jgi:hypothetical protein
MKFFLSATLLVSTFASTMASKCCWPTDPGPFVKLDHTCNDMVDEDEVGRRVAKDLEPEVQAAADSASRRLREDGKVHDIKNIQSVKYSRTKKVMDGAEHRKMKADDEANKKRKLQEKNRNLFQLDGPPFQAALRATECEVPELPPPQAERHLREEQHHRHLESACEGCGDQVCWTAADICGVLVDLVITIEVEVKYRRLATIYETEEIGNREITEEGYVLEYLYLDVDVTIITIEDPEDPWDCLVSVYYEVELDFYSLSVIKKTITFPMAQIMTTITEETTIELFASGSFDFSLTMLLPRICPKLWGDYCGERDAKVYMDPHFQTWHGEWYDFQGECDLAYLRAPEFDHGLGMEVQIRTTSRYDYSYVEEAAIKIGDDILQVGSFGDYMLNGVTGATTPTVMGGQFPLTHEAVNKKQHRFFIELSKDEHVIISTFKDMVNVDFKNATNQHFAGSSGLMGDYTDGKKYGRDGVKVFDADYDAFGQEWQVLESEENLFATLRAPQYPAKCNFPEALPKLDKGISQEAAEEACTNLVGAAKDRCVSDVMLTGDLDAASAGAY